jgi:hypothetical protein
VDEATQIKLALLCALVSGKGSVDVTTASYSAAIKKNLAFLTTLVGVPGPAPETVIVVKGSVATTGGVVTTTPIPTPSAGATGPIAEADLPDSVVTYAPTVA